MAGNSTPGGGTRPQPCGIPLRAKDPARYPLACRLVDLTDGCGSILYAHTTHNRAVYTCGRYMRTSAAECASNQVDAEAILRFTLKTLKQLVDQHGRRDKLREKLLERARLPAYAGFKPDLQTLHLTRLQNRRAELQSQRATIEYRMARERDDTLYAVLAGQYQAAKAELATAEEANRHELAHATVEERLPEAQVRQPWLLLDDVARITVDRAARG